RVGEVIARSDKRLDNGHLTSTSGDNEVSRMRPDPVAASDEKQMNESAHHCPVANDDERAALRVCGVERRHRVALIVGVMREMLLEHRMRRRLAGRKNLHAGRPARNIGDAPVDENELRGRVIAEGRGDEWSTGFSRSGTRLKSGLYVI